MAAKFQGSLLGLAIGDAVGTTVECMPRGSFAPVQGLEGGGKFNLSPGQWTDDTSMALCLAESLIECRGFNPTDQAERYVTWYQEGHLSSTGDCFDIGKTTLLALLRFQQSRDPYSGTSTERAAGNGCLMRLCPVPLCYSNHPNASVELAGLSAKVTHGAPAAVDACKYYSGLITGCVNGADKEVLLSDKYCPVPDYWHTHPMHQEVEEVACGSYKLKQPPEIKGSGYVIKSMEAALWAFYNTTNFRDGCLQAVNLGDDADTVGAIYGQLAGAYYGIDGIPDEWVEQCFLAPLIKLFADELYGLSMVVQPSDDWGKLNLDEVSEEYRSSKLQCYDRLEELNSKTIIRRAKPCPKQYKSLDEYDTDVEELRRLCKAVPHNRVNGLIVQDFEKRWLSTRDSLANRFSKRK